MNIAPAPKLNIDRQTRHRIKESHILSLTIIINDKTTVWLGLAEFFFLEKYKKLTYNTWTDYKIL